MIVLNLARTDSPFPDGEEYVYIGRGCWQRRRRIPRSPYANRFAIGKDGTREEVIAKYAEWLESRPELVQRLADSPAKYLLCHCAPLACHGDVLAKAVAKLRLQAD